MPHSARRAGAALAVLVIVGVLALLVARALAPSRTASRCRIAAAGDIAGADDYKTGAARTAEQIAAAEPDRVLALGDLAYDDGSVQQFRDYYAPTWGELDRLVEPIPGNHEGEASRGYVDHFGAAAARNRSIRVCGWRIVLVNQYAGIEEGAAFITDQAAAHPRDPLAVAWHSPRRSSGAEHGSDARVQPLWAAAVRAGARFVVNGHDHDAEVFAEMDASGKPTEGCTREFVSGLGGHHIRGWGEIAKGSQDRFSGQPAVLYLTLREDGRYSWGVRAVDGAWVFSGASTSAEGPPSQCA